MTEPAKTYLDSDTLDYYTANSVTYAADSMKLGHPEHLDAFLAKLKPGARILELGCGAGRDTAIFIEKGFDIVPTDGSRGLAREAEARLGRPVRIMFFHEMDFDGEFDAVWANASLLHVPTEGLDDIFNRVWRALKPGGLFYASFKSGGGGKRDVFGRYYNYPSRDFMAGLFARTGPWTEVSIQIKPGGSYDGTPVDWLHCFARRG